MVGMELVRDRATREPAPELSRRLVDTAFQRGVQQSETNADSTFRFDFARRPFRQTSLIVDPPDGRTPAVKPGGRTCITDTGRVSR